MAHDAVGLAVELGGLEAADADEGIVGIDDAPLQVGDGKKRLSFVQRVLTLGDVHVSPHGSGLLEMGGASA